MLKARLSICNWSYHTNQNALLLLVGLLITENNMQPLTPIEVAERIAAERKARKPKRDKINTQRRHDLEFEQDLRRAGFDVRKGVEL